MSLRSRLLALRAELDELIDQLPGDEQPKTRRRRAPARTRPKLAAVPTELQRARARSVLRAKGLIP